MMYLYEFPLIKYIPDELYVKMHYFKTIGHFPNLKDPKSFTEKLNWLKCYYHHPDLTSLVDKYEVKKIVSESIRKEHVVPLLGAWDILTRLILTVCRIHLSLRQHMTAAATMCAKTRKNLTGIQPARSS